MQAIITVNNDIVIHWSMLKHQEEHVSRSVFVFLYLSVHQLACGLPSLQRYACYGRLVSILIIVVNIAVLRAFFSNNTR